MDSPITRAEHEEFVKRMEAENHRQNRRIELLEENVLEIGQLTSTVAKLTISLESVVKEQARQSERLEALEDRDGEKWRTLISYVGTTVIGILIGYIFKLIGM